MVKIPTSRTPTHPGETLFKDFLRPMKLSPRSFANAVNIPFSTVQGIINGTENITPAMAESIAKFFGMTAGFWMNLQERWDSYKLRGA